MISDLYLASIKEIDSKNELKTFDCGIEQLNQFLVSYAKKNDSLGIGDAKERSLLLVIQNP